MKFRSDENMRARVIAKKTLLILLHSMYAESRNTTYFSFFNFILLWSTRMAKVYLQISKIGRAHV